MGRPRFGRPLGVALLVVGVLAWATGCADSVETRPTDPGRVAFVRVNAATVLHEGQSWTSTPNALAVTLYEEDCGDCGARVSDATVRGGPVGAMETLAWDETAQQFAGSVPVGVAYEVEVVVDGESTTLRLPALSAFEVSLSPDPPARDQSVDVTWSATSFDADHAGVGVTTPGGSVLLFPASGVGDDDGAEPLPASTWTEAGLYELRVSRRLDVESVEDGRRVTFGSSLQIDLEREVL